jgi:hypothetical protein
MGKSYTMYQGRILGIVSQHNKATNTTPLFGSSFVLKLFQAYFDNDTTCAQQSCVLCDTLYTNNHEIRRDH